MQNSIQKHTIDATGKSLGRVASQAAALLIGKKDPAFTRNAPLSIFVSIINAGKIKISEKKLTMKTYKTYSGYPGGLKTRSLSNSVDRFGKGKALIHAVKGMLPKNKLQPIFLKRLSIVE